MNSFQGNNRGSRCVLYAYLISKRASLVSSSKFVTFPQIILFHPCQPPVTVDDALTPHFVLLLPIVDLHLPLSNALSSQSYPFLFLMNELWDVHGVGPFFTLSVLLTGIAFTGIRVTSLDTRGVMERRQQ